MEKDGPIAQEPGITYFWSYVKSHVCLLSAHKNFICFLNPFSETSIAYRKKIQIWLTLSLARFEWISRQKYRFSRNRVWLISQSGEKKTLQIFCAFQPSFRSAWPSLHTSYTYMSDTWRKTKLPCSFLKNLEKLICANLKLFVSSELQIYVVEYRRWVITV